MFLLCLSRSKGADRRVERGLGESPLAERRVLARKSELGSATHEARVVEVKVGTKEAAR